MKTYIVIIENIKTQEGDRKFAEYINMNKFDFWRYTALNWILLTPDNIYTRALVRQVVDAYGLGLHYVLEVDIKDVGGMYTPQFDEKGAMLPESSPFLWFESIKRKNFVPRWEREKHKI